MRDETATSNSTPPWHLWVVGGLSLLWNAGGAFDFLMTQTRNEAYMSAFTPDQLDYFYSFPLWAVITWGGATWGSLWGSLFLLLRRSLEVPVFITALVCLGLTTLQNFVFSDGLTLMGGVGVLIFSATIVVVAVLLVLYARSLRARGILR
jgi:hypothetical protein